MKSFALGFSGSRCKLCSQGQHLVIGLTLKFEALQITIGLLAAHAYGRGLCCVLLALVAHVGVVLSDRNGVEPLVIQVVTETGCAVRVNRALTYRGVMVGLFGVLKNLAVINLRAVRNLEVLGVNPCLKPLRRSSALAGRSYSDQEPAVTVII